MLSNQKVVQKGKKGVYSTKHNLGINEIREEKPKQNLQDINDPSTTITEETKKNEKPKIEDNPSKIEDIPKNEDKKIVKKEENHSLPPYNNCGVNNFGGFNLNNNNFYDICKIELQYKSLFTIGLNSMSNPNNVNYPLFNIMNIFSSYLKPQNQLFPYNYNFNNNIINNFTNNMNPLYNNNCFQNPIINSLSNGNFIQNNINNPEKYTITLKSKTNDPTVEKISKITVTTSYIDNSASKQNNKETIKKLINLNDIILGKEKRTVVRLNPIPKKYSILNIIKLLDSHLKRERNKRIYKALYAPYTKGKEKNLGYCFIMMASPRHVIEIYNAFNGKVFGKKKNPNPSKIIWADKQGDEFLKLNDEDDDLRKPIIFNDCYVE